MLSARATQEFVPIKEIRNGVITLKSGELRGILIVSSINFSLKSYDEQKAILSQFQNFLNSLDFSTQIVIQSRKLDIRPYLILLESRVKAQEEPLLKIQTKEYMEFIKSLTEQINIMSKTFFVSVPYSAGEIQNQGSALKNLFSKKTKAGELSSFEEKRNQLEQRMSVIQQGLSSLGIRSVPLDTEELVELFYKTFNPGELIQNIQTG